MRMNIIIIPGFTGWPEEVTFQGLGETLTQKGHNVIKIAWPHFPDNLNKYSFTETIAHTRKVIESLKDKENLIFIGHSMSGVITSFLATEFKPKKMVYLVAPYQAGSEDDLAGKYKEWKETGSRIITSSKYGELTFPFSFIEDARKYNALDYVKNIDCPKLFIAGEIDQSVPWTVAKKVYDAANEPKEWHLIAGMEHKYKNQPEKLAEVNEIILKFIEN